MQTQARKSRLPSWVRAERRELHVRLTRAMGSRSQRSWARELGIPAQNISRYLSGGTSPHADFLIYLARHESINLNWLLLGEGRMRRRPES